MANRKSSPAPRTTPDRHGRTRDRKGFARPRVPRLALPERRRGDSCHRQSMTSGTCRPSLRRYAAASSDRITAMPAPVLTPFVPWLATAGFGWLYYRRIRRQFGRQVYQPRRTAIRIGLLSLVACGLAGRRVRDPARRTRAGSRRHRRRGARMAVAAAHVGRVGRWQARIHAQSVDRRRADALLLVARLAWRWHVGAFAAGAQQMGQQASPLTFGFMAALVAYYLVRGIGLALRMRALSAQPPARACRGCHRRRRKGCVAFSESTRSQSHPDVPSCTPGGVLATIA